MENSEDKKHVDSPTKETDAMRRLAQISNRYKPNLKVEGPSHPPNQIRQALAANESHRHHVDGESPLLKKVNKGSKVKSMTDLGCLQVDTGHADQKSNMSATQSVENMALDKDLINKSDPKTTGLRTKFCKNEVSIIGVAVKEGQQLGGVELSPALFRECGLKRCIEELGWKINDLGDVKTEDLEEEVEKLIKSEKKWKYELANSEILGVSNEMLADVTHKASQRKDFTLILGGDHGLATGSIGGMLRTYPNLKVVWVDAHGDCNIPETSPSQNYHGMPVAHLLGWMKQGEVKGFDWLVPALKPENIVFIGLRDVDEGEKLLLKKHNIKAYAPYDIELKGGIANVMNEIMDYLKIDEDCQTPLHISWDVDGCDPIFMPGTGTRARGGLTLRESHFILERLWRTGNIVSMDLVEVNTLLEDNVDREILHGDIPYLIGTQTLIYASELILTAMGHSKL